MALPEQLLLSDLLSRRVRCDQGLDHGPGQLGWMHPPVHRLLGWATRPVPFSPRRRMWRLNQLKGLGEGEAYVQGEPSDTDADTLLRLPTLLRATLYGSDRQPLGQLADAAVDLRSGRILHYLVARSDPRLPAGSRWRLSPERIVDQRPAEVFTALESLEDLPLARASVRQAFLRRSRRWRDQLSQESARLRDQWQEVSGRVEERLEGWLEEPPWEEPPPARPRRPFSEDIWEEAAEHAEGDGAWPGADRARGGRTEPARAHGAAPDAEQDRWDWNDDEDGGERDGGPFRRRGENDQRRFSEDPRERPIPAGRRRPLSVERPDDEHDDPWI